MTPTEAADVLRRVSIGHGGFDAWDLRFQCRPFSDGITITLQARLPHRDTGEVSRGRDAHFHCQIFLAVLIQMNERAFLVALRKAWLEFVAHEFDESLLLDGKRVFDPHALLGHRPLGVILDEVAR